MFTYTGLYAFGITCGRESFDAATDGDHPFSETSDVLTVTSFGFDNCVPYLVNVPHVASELGMRPYDHVMTNFFYTLEGEKFSTSRDHVIVERTKVNVDFLRFYVGRTSPEAGRSNFSIDEFTSTHNRLAEIFAVVSERWRTASRNAITAPPEEMLADLDAAIARQDRDLSFERFSLRSAAAELMKWLEAGVARRASAETDGWWVKSTALLCAPIMPSVAHVLWRACGGSGEPTLAAFPEPIRATSETIDLDHEPLSRGDVAAAARLGSAR